MYTLTFFKINTHMTDTCVCNRRSVAIGKIIISFLKSYIFSRVFKLFGNLLHSFISILFTFKKKKLSVLQNWD